MDNPKTYSDKLGWYILYYRDERMQICTDKASVRDYVESVGMGNLLNECYGVYDRVEEIDWDSLPDKFVLKHTLSGSGQGVILVFDKKSMDMEQISKRLHFWVDSPPLR